MAKKNFKKPMKLKEQSRTMKLSEPSSMLPSSMANLMPEQNTTDSSQFDSAAKSQMKPIGTSGTELFAGYFSEEYLQLLRGRKGAKIFDEMRRSEAQVAMLLSAVMNPIKSGVWEFEASSEVADGETHKEFIEFCAKDMIDWETHLHEALTMMIFGYSVFEIIHSVVFNHPKFGTFNGLKGLAFRSQKTIERWIVDNDTGNLKVVQQWVQGDLVRDKSALLDMLAEFLLIFTVQKEGDNYEGISALRPMYGPWFRKNLYLRIAAIGIEKNAIGTPMGTTPKGKQKAEDEAAFKEVLENFTAHEAAYLIKPEGWEIELLESKFNAAAVKEMILLENTEMINSLVANFLALGTNGGGGAFALGSDLSDFFLTGIQNYANIIAGVWNRKLIPDLIKLNYGPQPAYPKLKATGINDKAGKELADVVKTLVDSQALKPDTPMEEFLRKAFGLPKIDPTTTREPKPATPAFGAPPSAQFSEQRIQLAETWKVQWKNDRDSVKEVMQTGLTSLLESYKKQIESKWKTSTKATRANIGLQLEPKGLNAYRESLREELARIANTALIGARKETPKAKNVKLSEVIQLAAPKGGYFDALPNNVKRIVKAQADLIAQTQAADLEKIVSFQFASSQTSTDDVDQVLNDIDDAAEPTIEGSTANGMSVDAAAGNAVSSVANQARLEWFFEPEVLDTIDSFTFFNEDPVSEICQELDGTTWATNDPDLDRYSPPLHHNCKSRLVPNEKGAEGNPDIQRGGTPISQKALDSMTLHECSSCGYGLDFANIKLGGPGSGPQGGGGPKDESGGPASVNQHDKDAAFTVASSGVSDKDYGSFEDGFEASLANAKVETVNAENAGNFYRAHKEDMHDNSQKSYTKATARGKDLTDPAIGVRIKGKVYVIDGQHRLNQALKEGREQKIVVMDGAFMAKSGADKKVMEGRTNSGI
jgi:hypothetical protein